MIRVCIYALFFVCLFWATLASADREVRNSDHVGMMAKGTKLYNRCFKEFFEEYAVQKYDGACKLIGKDLNGLKDVAKSNTFRCVEKFGNVKKPFRVRLAMKNIPSVGADFGAHVLCNVQKVHEDGEVESESRMFFHGGNPDNLVEVNTSATKKVNGDQILHSITSECNGEKKAYSAKAKGKESYDLAVGEKVIPNVSLNMLMRHMQCQVKVAELANSADRANRNVMINPRNKARRGSRRTRR